MIQDNMDFEYSNTPQEEVDSVEYGLDFGLKPEQSTQPIQQPVEPQQPVDDNWQVRASYFQSQYDRLKNQVESYMPLIQTLESDQSAAQRVIAALQGQPVPVQQPEPEVVLPSRPSKPEDYNYEEAISDPSSQSFKYRVALEEYNEKLGEYVAYKDAREREEATKAEQIAKQYAMMQQKTQQQQEFLDSTYNHLLTTRNFSPDEAKLFISEMADDSAITLDNLIGYWRWMKGQQHQPRVQPKSLNMPYPAINGGGRSNNQPQANPDAQFSQMLRTK